MSFQSLAFFGFLAVALAVCLPVGRRSSGAGAALLTAASAVFYLLGPGGPAVVLGGLACLRRGICVTSWAIRRMARSGGSRRRTMVLACVYHIAVLVGFKYTEFLTGGAVEVGWAPLGLSFFTFQQLWLLKEVCTGEYVPAAGDSLLLYGLFFPTVTSGPILRPEGFFPQLRGESFLRPDWSDAAAGVDEPEFFRTHEDFPEQHLLCLLRSHGAGSGQPEYIRGGLTDECDVRFQHVPRHPGDVVEGIMLQKFDFVPVDFPDHRMAEVVQRVEVIALRDVGDCPLHLRNKRFFELPVVAFEFVDEFDHPFAIGGVASGEDEFLQFRVEPFAGLTIELRHLAGGGGDFPVGFLVLFEGLGYWIHDKKPGWSARRGSTS